VGTNGSRFNRSDNSERYVSRRLRLNPLRGDLVLAIGLALIALYFTGVLCATK
jgi:hypothetical protein